LGKLWLEPNVLGERIVAVNRGYFKAFNTDRQVLFREILAPGI